MCCSVSTRPASIAKQGAFGKVAVHSDRNKIRGQPATDGRGVAESLSDTRLAYPVIPAAMVNCNRNPGVWAPLLRVSGWARAQEFLQPQQYYYQRRD
jgi:hypothetical protein